MSLEISVSDEEPARAHVCPLQLGIYRVKETVVTAGAWKVYVRAADGVQSGDITVAN